MLHRGGRQQGRNEEGLRRRQLAWRLPEVVRRRWSNAVDARAELHDVQVKLHELPFGEVLFEEHRERSFLELAGERLGPRQVQVLGKLHAERAGATHERSGAHVVTNGRLDGAIVEAFMAVKATVFG